LDNHECLVLRKNPLPVRVVDFLIEYF
jgi:hypothetical protein